MNVNIAARAPGGKRMFFMHPTMQHYFAWRVCITISVSGLHGGNRWHGNPPRVQQGAWVAHLLSLIAGLMPGYTCSDVNTCALSMTAGTCQCLMACTHLADLTSANSNSRLISAGRFQWVQNIKHV